MSIEFDNFIERLDALGENPTEEQVEALVSWVVDNLDQDEWAAAANASLMSGMEGDFYTEMRMRTGECGI